jgi:hypothetical protein
MFPTSQTAQPGNVRKPSYTPVPHGGTERLEIDDNSASPTGNLSAWSTRSSFTRNTIHILDTTLSRPWPKYYRGSQNQPRPQPRRTIASSWYACDNSRATEDGAQVCCMAKEQCGPDSICMVKNNYYVGECTDATYGDPVCRTSCSQ